LVNDWVSSCHLLLGQYTYYFCLLTPQFSTITYPEVLWGAC